MISTRRSALYAYAAVILLILSAVILAMQPPARVSWPAVLTITLSISATLLFYVSKLRALEAAARRAEAYRQQLDKANQELRSTHAKRIELEMLRSEFFASVSHELRTPLTLLVGPIDYLLSSETLTADQKTVLQLAKRNARALQQHVDDLLDVSNLQTGKATLQYARVDLVPLVRLTASYFELVAHQSHVTFTVDTPPSLVAEVDQNKFRHIILNLFADAFKFVPDHGFVRCALQIQNHCAVLLMEDNGPESLPGVRPGVFLRMRRPADDGTNSGGTSSLGLTIAAEFISLHDGIILVESTPSGGPVFRVELPLNAPAGTVIGDATAESFDKAVAENMLENLRPGSISRMDTIKDASRPLILIVEDNPEMNRFISVTLSDKYRVASAYDGEEGLERALALHPDLIISDLMMPHMDGAELIRAIRTRSSLDGIPIMLLTASPEDDIRIQLLREGAQDYLIKPFSVDELQVRIGNLIAQKRAHDMLQQELASQGKDVAVLASELTRRKSELDVALSDLRLSQSRFRRLSEANIIGIMTAHLDGSIAEVNAAFLDMLGYNREDMIAGKRTWVEITPPEYRDQEAHAIRELQTTGIANPWEKEFIRRDGTRIPVLIGSAMLEGSQDTFICFVVDLTERKRTEEAQRFLAQASDVLASSLDYKETLRSLVNFTVPRFADWCSVYVIDEEGELQLVDASIFDPEKKSILDAFSNKYPVHLEDTTDIAEVLYTGQAQLISEITPQYLELRVDPDRRELLRTLGARSRIVVPLEARGHVFGVMAFNLATPERLYTPADLRLAQDLGRRAGLAVDNARLYRESQQAISARDEFLSVAAHELKTPVTSLRGFSQLTLRYIDKNSELDVARIQKALESIDQQAEKLARLIQQLLGISRIQSGRLVLERESMNLRQLTDTVANSGQARTTKHTITVEGAAYLDLYADPLRLEQVLTNLVDNAIKYSPEGGPIKIEVVSEEDNKIARFSITDHGLGIPPEHREHIFDLFYQAHGPNKLGGMGLGLYISREIVELHGGSLDVTFPEEGGSCFTVRLPISVSTATETHNATEKTKESQG